MRKINFLFLYIVKYAYGYLMCESNSGHSARGGFDLMQ
jgi:hypothetical protein